MKRSTQWLGRVVIVGLAVMLFAGFGVAGQTMTAASAPVSANQAVTGCGDRVEAYFSAVLSKANGAAAKPSWRPNSGARTAARPA